MTTRHRLLLLLRKQPGVTVSELASSLQLTGMGVRRHLEALAAAGLAESAPTPRAGPGRPPSGWRLTDAGLELFPRTYDSVAVDVLDDVGEQFGKPAVDALFARRGRKLAADYRKEMAGAHDVEQRIRELAGLRDAAGYVAECGPGEHDGEYMLIESNCAVHKVAERYPTICGMELNVFREALGPEVEVTRVKHIMAGDGVCAYRIRKRA